MVALLAACAVVVLLGPIGRPLRRSPVPNVAVVDSDSEERSGPHTQRRRRLVLVAVVIGSAFVLGLLATAALIVAVGAAPRVRDVVAARAAKQAIDAALPDAIEILVLVIHAGLTPHQAIGVLAERAPAPVRPGFIEVRHRVRRGAPLADALQALPDTLGPGANAVADTLAMAERHGSPIAWTLEQLALDGRERRRRRAEAEARKLPIRLSFPLVACTLPAFVLVAIVPAVLAALRSLGDSGF